MVFVVVCLLCSTADHTCWTLKNFVI